MVATKCSSSCNKEQLGRKRLLRTNVVATDRNSSKAKESIQKRTGTGAAPNLRLRPTSARSLVNQSEPLRSSIPGNRSFKRSGIAGNIGRKKLDSSGAGDSRLITRKTALPRLAPSVSNIATYPQESMKTLAPRPPPKMPNVTLQSSFTTKLSVPTGHSQEMPTSRIGVRNSKKTAQRNTRIMPTLDIFLKKPKDCAVTTGCAAPPLEDHASAFSRVSTAASTPHQNDCGLSVTHKSSEEEDVEMQPANSPTQEARQNLFGPGAAVNNFIVLSIDRVILNSPWSSITCLRHDTAAYGQDWLLHHRAREEEFQPWQFTVAGRVDKLRLSVISMYWDSLKLYQISPATVFLAINNFGRLLSTWSVAELEKPSASKWAITAMVAYRLAFKVEERPESLWEVVNFWNIFSLFRSWEIDKSEESLNKMEIEAMKSLQDSMDMPLAPMFLALYLAAGGWPKDVAREYHELGLYLLALATFSTARDYLLHCVTPSKLAAAALMLAIKIVNGDRSSAQGVMKHLPTCKAATPNRGTAKTIAAWLEEEGNSDLKTLCSCRYEFFPTRLRIYANLSLEEIQPAVKGLSSLLRTRDPETAVLRHFFPAWGDNDWQ